MVAYKLTLAICVDEFPGNRCFVSRLIIDRWKGQMRGRGSSEKRSEDGARHKGPSVQGGLGGEGFVSFETLDIGKGFSQC